MTSYSIQVTPVTTMDQIQKKLDAFKELYQKEIEVVAKGFCINTIDKTIPWVKPATGLKVTSIGKQYLTIEYDGLTLKVNIKNPNHGIKSLQIYCND